MSMFWKGRRGKKRLVELITVRNLLQVPARVQKSNEKQRIKGMKGYLPSERTYRIQSRVPGFAEWGLCPQNVYYSRQQ